MPTSRETVPTQRGRQREPSPYRAQLILMTDSDTERFIRAYAAVRGVPVTAVLRDWTWRVIDSMDPATRALVETRMEDDGTSE